MSGLVFQKFGPFQMAARPCRTKLLGWMSWAVRGELTPGSEGPLNEPRDRDVWFEFGATDVEAFDKLKRHLAGLLQ